MSRWEALKNRLSHTLGVQFRLEEIPTADWPTNKSELIPANKHQAGEYLHFWLAESNAYTETIVTKASELSEREQQMVLWVLQENGCNPETTHAILSQAIFSDQKIVPIYLQNRHEQNIDLKELENIIHSFINSKTVVVALEHFGALVLATEKSIDLQTEDTVEESLVTFCSAIQEMLVSEMGIEVDLSAALPIHAETELIQTLSYLKENISIGKKFYPQSYVHVGWELKIEQVVNHLPESYTDHFVQSVRAQLEQDEDAEMQTTIEVFFAANCNVSETAKQLFIHRNTLLYRLDRFKQVTGYDVRDFNDAVFIKLFMLLDKVTKTN
jgi:sugar diacid utilization regulator